MPQSRKCVREPITVDEPIGRITNVVPGAIQEVTQGVTGATPICMSAFSGLAKGVEK